ncbi:hypothetical protein Trydic_g14019 [Trypoxylus dichotomus]
MTIRSSFTSAALITFILKHDYVCILTNAIRKYAASPTCHTREQPLGAERVRGHCHFTGKYRMQHTLNAS